MNDPISAYFIFKIFTNRIFWACCGFTFLYGFIGQKLTPPAPAPIINDCTEVSCPNPKKVISELTQAISKNPKDSGLYVSRGSTYCIMGQISQCLSNFDIAINLSPDKAATYSTLGITLVRIDRVRSSKAFDQAIQLYTQNGDTTNAARNREIKSLFRL